MAQRTVILTGTLTDAGGALLVGAPASATIDSPNNGNPLDGNGALVSVLTVSTATNGSGVYALTVDYTPDFTTPGCSITVNENGLLTYIPVSYTYASTYPTSTWSNPTPATGTLLVYADIFTLSDTAVPGDVGTLYLSQTGIGSAGQFLSANTPISAKSDSNGRFRWNILPNSLISPAGTTYKLTVAGEPSSFVFTVPAAPSGYQGAYNGATAYHVNAGTKVSPSDVVLSGGVLYQAIANTTGNTPPNATYWRVWPGEPLTWWITLTQTTGGLQIDETGVRADLTAATGTYAVPPVTLQDQLRALTQYPVTPITATTYTALATDRIIDADGTANAVAITLPTAVGWTGLLAVKAINLTHAVTIIGTVDGAAGPITPALNQTLVFFGDGTNWHIYAQYSTTGSGTVTRVSGTAPISVATGTTTPAITIATATPTALGVVEVDQTPGSGSPIALTTSRLAAALGLAPLAGDVSIPSAFLPTALGSIAESGRWTKAGAAILTAAVTWEGAAVVEPSLIQDASSWWMAYRGGWSTTGIGLASCPLASDPTVAANWTKYASNPIVGTTGNPQQPTLKKFGTTYYLYYAMGGAWTVRTATTLLGLAGATGSTALVVGGGVTQWANSTVIRDPDGTWHALLEGLTSGTWKIYVLTSTDGLSWTVGNSGAALSTLQIHATGAFGGPSLLPYKVNGLYHLWYHAVNAASNLPTNIYHAASPDLITWTVAGGSTVLTLAGTGFEIDQVADPDVAEANRVAYLFYDGDDNTLFLASIGAASIVATVHEVVSESASAASLELTDGTHDVTGVTKITVSGAVVGGTSSAATLTVSAGGIVHEPVLLNPAAPPDFVTLAGDIVVL